MSTQTEREIPCLIPGSPAAETGKQTGNPPTEPGNETGISFREAALRLSISEKTLRARIRTGEIRAWSVEGKRGMEWRVHLPEVRDGDRPSPDEARDQDRDGDRDADRGDRDHDRDHDRPSARAPVAALQARLDGAHLAAKLHAQRAAEARRQAEEERTRRESEVGFLRAQLEQSRQAEEQLRILLLEQARALQALTEPKVLPPADPPRRRWWWPW